MWIKETENAPKEGRSSQARGSPYSQQEEESHITRVIGQGMLNFVDHNVLAIRTSD